MTLRLELPGPKSSTVHSASASREFLLCIGPHRYMSIHALYPQQLGNKVVHFGIEGVVHQEDSLPDLL